MRDLAVLLLYIKQNLALHPSLYHQQLPVIFIRLMEHFCLCEHMLEYFEVHKD